MGKINVKIEEFKNDYVEIVREKELTLQELLSQLNERVEREIENLRPAIVEKVTKSIHDEVNKEYDFKIELYEKYLVETSEENLPH